MAQYWNLRAALVGRIASFARQYPIDASSACDGCVTHTKLALRIRTRWVVAPSRGAREIRSVQTQ